MDSFEHDKFIQVIRKNYPEKFDTPDMFLGQYVDRRGRLISKELWDHLSHLPEYYLLIKEDIDPFKVYTAWIGESVAPFRTVCVNTHMAKRIRGCAAYTVIYSEDSHCESQAWKVHQKVVFYTDQNFFSSI